MFCQKCGFKNIEDANFCNSCGFNMKQGTGGFTSQQSSEPELIRIKEFRCNSCGAPLKIPKNSRKPVRCASCKVECIIEGWVRNAEIAAKENINSGIPLTASPKKLYSNLVSHFFSAQNLPDDFFDTVEVIKEEHYCIPAYLYYCNATASFTYDIANTKERTISKVVNDKEVTEVESYIEWQHMSSNASKSATIIVPGTKEFIEPIRRFYELYDPKELVDIEELDYPCDVITIDYNIPHTASFNEYAKPFMEQELRSKAVNSLGGKQYRDLVMGGSNIQKNEALRIYLGMYRVTYRYNGQDYYMYNIGDGKKSIHPFTPVNKQHESENNRFQNDLSDAQSQLHSIRNKLISGYVTGIVISAIIAFIASFSAFGSASTGGILFFIGSLVLGGSFIYKIVSAKKLNAENKRKRAELNSSINTAKDNIRRLEDHTAGIKQRFFDQKRSLRGIYSNLETPNPRER